MYKIIILYPQIDIEEMPPDAQEIINVISIAL
jgi:hypothetical protein